MDLETHSNPNASIAGTAPQAATLPIASDIEPLANLAKASRRRRGPRRRKPTKAEVEFVDHFALALAHSGRSIR